MTTAFDIVIILLGIYCFIAVILWIITFIMNIRLFYRHYNIVEDEKYNINHLEEILKQEKVTLSLDIKIYASSYPQMIYLRENIWPKQVFPRPTLLISTSFFEDPFNSNDRLGMFSIILYYIQKVDFQNLKGGKKLKPWQKLLVFIILQLIVLLGFSVFFLPIITIFEVLSLWFGEIFIFIFISGLNQIKMTYEADYYAHGRMDKYPEVLKKVATEMGRQTKKRWRVFYIILPFFGIIPRPALKKRLNKLTPIRKEINCPQCSEIIPQGLSWCRTCHFSLLTQLSYPQFILWNSLIVLIMSLIPAIAISFFNPRDLSTMISLVYGLITILILGHLTNYFHFRKILIKKPNPLVMTGVLGLIILLITMFTFSLVLITSDELLSDDPVIKILGSAIVGYILGGFLFYYLYVDNRFKSSPIQKSLPRCPACTIVINSQTKICPHCNQVISSESTIQPKHPSSTLTPNLRSNAALKFCPQCGTPRFGLGNFCIKCGLRFPVPPSEGSTAEHEKIRK
jgi:RNA polymerase subunit RPABC4/transcription elongation factor Spt4